MMVSASVASADLLHIAREVDYIDRCFGALHLDLEDGVYLPNITFGFKVARGVCARSASRKSLHLMLRDPLAWLEDVTACRADMVFLHVDHLERPVEALRRCRAAGIPTGLGLSDRDLGRDLSPLLAEAEEVLVLTARLEDRAQRYDPALGDMAANLARRGLRVWADGGLDAERLAPLGAAGVYGAVLGRAVFSDREAAARLYGNKTTG